MRKCLAFVLISTGVFFLQAQQGQSSSNSIADSLGRAQQINGYQRILNNLSAIPQGVTLGGYAEVLYNQSTNLNGELDVERLVMLFGYKFDDRVQFVTEIEFEHVSEVYVEQAFVNYSFINGVNIRAGLMLVPMGIISEFHEPTTFNGVERPSMDRLIVPTTWREIGIGVTGRLDGLGLRYQAYLFNGFLSHDGVEGQLSGATGLRGGRQKGAKSVVDQFNISAKLDYYGIPNLRLGLSAYAGRTQAVDEQNAIPGSDIGLAMLGLDARFKRKNISARAQFVQANLSDTDAYNRLTGSDLGSALGGYYIETAYNLFPLINRQRLDAFVRYESYDTHKKVGAAITRNPAFEREEWTLGLSYHMSIGTVFKVDYQSKRTGITDSQFGQFNVGVGVWF
ncbi:hypothetical protein N9Z01_06280 [Flavobacteriaceae bacterium]|nr:hypothetical protein [Flavobacteriaceae bacterium]